MKGMRLVNCDCDRGLAAAFQDQKYGKGKRVANESGKKDDNSAKCTVCGRVHQRQAPPREDTAASAKKTEPKKK